MLKVIPLGLALLYRYYPLTWRILWLSFYYCYCSCFLFLFVYCYRKIQFFIHCNFFCQEVAPHFSNRAEHLNTSGIRITSHGADSFRVKPITPGHLILKISTHLNIFWGGTRKTREDIIIRETRPIPQEILNRVVDNFNVWVAAVLSYSSAVHGTNSINYWKSIVKHYWF